MAFDWVGTNERVATERGKAQESEWIHADQGVITWTRPKLERFKLEVAEAGTSFEFEGKFFLTAYAKYLIRYLDEILA